MFGECLLDIIFNFCIKNDKVVKVIIKVLDRYLEKIKMLFKKIKDF